MYTAVDFVRDQLIEQEGSVNWNINGQDQSKVLAQRFVDAGVRDLTKLSIARRIASEYSQDFGLIETPEYLLMYEGRQVPYQGTSDGVLAFEMGALEIGWNAEGKGHVKYLMRPVTRGFQIYPAWGSSSDAADIRESLTFIAMVGVSIVLPNAGISVGKILGQAILGNALSAAYPLLSSAVGNVALSTVMTGGNIEQAVKSTVLSMAGVEAGALVGGAAAAATGFDAIGKAASAATAALVQGGDVKNAVAVSLLQSGVKMNDDTNFGFDAVEYGTVDMTGFENAGMFQSPGLVETSFLQPNTGFVDNTFLQNELALNYTGPGFVSDGFLQDYLTSPIEQPALAPLPTNLFPQTDIKPAIPTIGDFSLTTVINSVSAAALSALTLVRAYQAVKNPTINQTARTVTADGSVVIASNDGYIRTQRPTGAVTVTKPAVGMAQSTLDGSIIVNNGDGTYTKTNSLGQSQIVRYTAATGVGGVTAANTINIGGFEISPVMLAIAGLGLVLVLKGR